MSLNSKPKSFFLVIQLILAVAAIFAINNCGGGDNPPIIPDGGTMAPDGGPHDGGIRDGGIRDGGIRDGGPRPDGGYDGGPSDGGDGGTTEDGGPDGGDAGIPDYDGGLALDGGCDGPAKALINEVNQKIIYDADMVELKITQCGILNNVLLQLNPGVSPTKGKLTLATLSDLTVDEGDIIVVHLGPNPDGGELVITETNASGKTSCPPSAGCYDSAWDIRGITEGIPNTERVIAVGFTGGDGGMGPIQDAVPFVSDSAPSAGFLDALKHIQNNGQWSPASCDGGADCSSICVNWSSCTSSRTTSTQRTGATDTNSASDWQPSGANGSSWGQ